MIKCTECLSDNPEGALYCNHCGRRIFVQQPRPLSPPEEFIRADPRRQPTELPPLPKNYEDDLARPSSGVASKFQDSFGDKITALVFGVLIFALSIWAHDWARINPAMDLVTAIAWLAIIILAGKSRPRPDLLTYLGMILLFCFPVTTMLAWYYAGLTIVRKFKAT